MSDLVGAPPGPARCWNCGQPLKSGAQQCVFCGMAQAQGQPTQFVVAPSAAAGAVAPQVQHAPQQTWNPAPPPEPGRAPSSRAPLDPAFAGSAAGAGAQLAAFTVDVLVVLAVSTAVLLLSGEIVFAVIALVELVVGLCVLEARTGATVGNALLRIRVSRDDAPYSPGIGRSFVRRMLTGVGFLVLGLGAWIVVASGAWDRSGRSRGWADGAARTQFVAVPRRARVAGRTSQAAAAVPLQGPAPSVLAAPQVVSTLVRQHGVDEDSVSQSQTGAPAPGFPASPAQPAASAPAAARIDPPSAPVSEGVTDGTILLVFDTGQRVQFPTPVAVNLGRNPAPTEPTDMLVTVQDPEVTVSKTHLRLEHSRGRTWVTDGGSTNGTELLDDEGSVTALAAGNRVLLDEGVRVRIGNRAFTISLILGGEK